MTEPSSGLVWLRDPRLMLLAVSPLPAWLWAADASRVLWANPTGAAMFGAATPFALAARKFDQGQPAAAQIARLAATLPAQGARLERLRGFGAGIGRALTCACSQITLADDTSAVLVVATERAGPDLRLNERLQRLLAGIDGPLAFFSADGKLIHASSAALAQFNDAQSLSALGTDIAVARIGADAAPILITMFERARPTGDAPLAGASEFEVEPVGPVPAQRALGNPPDPPAETVKPPSLTNAPPTRLESLPAKPFTGREPSAAPAPPPIERRHPLRFVWQIDDHGRFTIGSDEFIQLIGRRTADALGGLWSDVVAMLGVDPEGQVARAIATHETWSGLNLAWPVDGREERLTVELSGLPVFDRDRMFRGYRGFGVCRDLAGLNAVLQTRALSVVAEPDSLPSKAFEPEPKHPVDDLPLPLDAEIHAASGSADREDRLLTLVSQAENVVPFRPPTTELTPPSLTPIEHHAFRELSRRLNERLNRSAPADNEGADQVSVGDGDAEAAARAESPMAEHLARRTDRAADEGAAHAEFGGDPDEAVEEEGGAIRSLLDRFPIGVLVYRLNHLLYANRAFLEWSGYEHLDALVDAGGLDSLLVESGAIAIEEGGRKSFAVSRGGLAKAPAEGRLFLVPWDGASAFALVTIPVNEGHHLQASDASELAHPEIAELHAILDIATDGVIVVDRHARIVSSNRSAQALFGCEAGELAGRPFVDLFAPESVDVATDYLDSIQVNGVASLLNDGRDVIGREHRGGLIPLFMTMGRIGKSADRFCAVFRDITPWKKAEDELAEATRQADGTSSAKSDFLAKISHEIRTPLNAIIGFSEVMMEERFGPIGNDRYRQYLQDIHTSGGHLLSLINDLLDLSRIEAGKLELSFTEIPLNELTQQCVAVMQPQANRERIVIRTSLSPKLPRVLADARSVRQIVLNLLSNSIKFTNAGGQVIVSTAHTDLGDVVLRVRDTGIGMSEKDIATTLEPFRQLATSTRWGSGSTGLGLPLTKALAEANRARFAIKSTPKSGTLVEVIFRAARVTA